MKKLQELLEDDYEDFESLENVEKSSNVLGSELWESKFDGLLALVKHINHRSSKVDTSIIGLRRSTHPSTKVDTSIFESRHIDLLKEYIVDVWEIRKHKLYDSDSGYGLQFHTQSSPGERSGKFSQNGKFVSLAGMISLAKMVCLVRKVKCI